MVGNEDRLLTDAEMGELPKWVDGTIEPGDVAIAQDAKNGARIHDLELERDALRLKGQALAACVNNQILLDEANGLVCYCDPPGAGNKHCWGTCFQKAALADWTA